MRSASGDDSEEEAGDGWRPRGGRSGSAAASSNPSSSLNRDPGGVAAVQSR